MNTTIFEGTFFGGDVEPGTFHYNNLPFEVEEVSDAPEGCCDGSGEKSPEKEDDPDGSAEESN